MKTVEIKKAVREGYAKIAKQGSSCCTPTIPCCESENTAEDISKMIGYTEEELETAPEGANLGFGCGNPVALASLKEGETVLDLGSGAGFDCFLAAQKVGKSGKVIGVDMTPEMVEKARKNADNGKYHNVEFRLGEIENLPVEDNTVDAVISNCVINLSPDKPRAFREAFRVLKPGGKLMVSDIVLSKEPPDFLRNSIEAYIGCVAGATLKGKYTEAIKAAGFLEVKIIEDTSLPAESCIEKTKLSQEKVKEITRSVVSIKVYGLKPKGII